MFLSRQITAWISAVVICVITLAVAGSYIFYSLLSNVTTFQETETDVWESTDWALLGLISCFSLTVGILSAIKVSRKIIIPLNSVSLGLRSLASGDLNARAAAPDNSLKEASILVADFNKMADKLHRLDQEQTFWNAAIAHELRTPLTILRGRIQGLIDGVFLPNQAQFSILMRQVEGLTRITEDLRVVSLADNDHLNIELQKCELGKKVVSDSLELKSHLTAAGLTLTLDISKEPVWCDPGRILQALSALFENTLRHSTPGNVSVRLINKDNINILSVSDDGPGIEESYLGKIFDPFQRCERSRSRAQGGSGLGLAVVRAIAWAHHGSVTCSKSHTGGTTFEILWPNQPASK
ncbi:MULTISPECIES: ATP-binding protein [Pseudomonas]|uniref:ATP-binding protein n=1 Tax=Pseudomonas TaxID=286 RepID=UPI00398FEFD8